MKRIWLASGTGSRNAPGFLVGRAFQRRKRIRLGLRRAPLGLVLLVALASCIRTGVSPVVRTSAVSSSAQGAYRTFLVMDSGTPTDFEAWDSTLTRNDLTQEVTRQMRLRGYRPTDYGPGTQPDLLVYCSLFEGPISIHHLSPTGAAAGDRLPTRRNHQLLQGGVLLIQFRDTRSKKIIWQGYLDGLRTSEWPTTKPMLALAAQQILDAYQQVATELLARKQAGR